MLNDFDEHNKGDNPSKINKTSIQNRLAFIGKKESEQNNLLS